MVRGKVVEEHEFFFDASEGEVYSDGSCKWPTIHQLCQAGMAAIQVNEHGEVVKMIQCRIPLHCPQTASFSEHFSIGVIALYTIAVGGLVVHTDCASTIAAFLDESLRLSGRKDYCSVWHSYGEHVHKVASLVKVKAHQTKQQVQRVADKNDQNRHQYAKAGTVPSGSS